MASIKTGYNSVIGKNAIAIIYFQVSQVTWDQALFLFCLFKMCLAIQYHEPRVTSKRDTRQTALSVIL